MDIGADTTLVKVEALSPHVQIDVSNQKDLSGAFVGSITTKGTITAQPAGIKALALQMHVVPGGYRLQADGLLVRDV